MMARSKPRPKPFFPAPGEIDSSNLDLYLTELGIDYQHRNEIISKATNAVLQYGQPYNHQRLKIRLEKVAAAAKKLRECLPPAGGFDAVEFVNAVASTFPTSEFIEDGCLASAPVRQNSWVE